MENRMGGAHQAPIEPRDRSPRGPMFSEIQSVKALGSSKGGLWAEFSNQTKASRGAVILSKKPRAT
jgi:hypothetical protein